MGIQGLTELKGYFSRCTAAIVAGFIITWVIPLTALASTSGDNEGVHDDPIADAVARQTDPGATLEFDTLLHHLPDLLEIRVVSFEPTDPSVDLFAGQAIQSSSEADFFRLDLVLDGLANPPGSVDPASFNPFRFGDHPVYGFVEIDMDDDVMTGGELSAPQYRYLGNVVRFGGMVDKEKFWDRVAIDASAFDGDITTAPFVDRSGEEFHLALLGGHFDTNDIVELVGDGDSTFDASETWRISGAFLHRAHGYEPFVFAKGGAHPGEYSPATTLEFSHDGESDRTTISLVFPLTHVGAALVSGKAIEELNADPTDQASVLEGLHDLHESAEFLAQFPTGDPEEVILTAWADRDAESQLDTHDWDVTVLLGSSYTESSPFGVYYLWSDVHHNVVRGDMNGDKEFSNRDRNLITAFIRQQDASDGILDDAVAIAEFASDFSLYDVNHDGVVTAFDILAGESDRAGDDDDFDLVDLAAFQQCFLLNSGEVEECIEMDLDINGTVDLGDFRMLRKKFTGPE